MLGVPVISVDAYPFLAFPDLTCYLDDTGMGVFWLHCAPDSKETELGSSDQAASSSAGRTTRVILVPCHTWKCVPTAISGGVLRYLRSLCVICYDRWVFSVGCKNYFKDWCFMNSQPTFPFLTYFNSMIYGHIIKKM